MDLDRPLSSEERAKLMQRGAFLVELYHALGRPLPRDEPEVTLARSFAPLFEGETIGPLRRIIDWAKRQKWEYGHPNLADLLERQAQGRREAAEARALADYRASGAECVWCEGTGHEVVLAVDNEAGTYWPIACQCSCALGPRRLKGAPTASMCTEAMSREGVAVERVRAAHRSRREQGLRSWSALRALEGEIGTTATAESARRVAQRLSRADARPDQVEQFRQWAAVDGLVEVFDRFFRPPPPSGGSSMGEIISEFR